MNKINLEHPFTPPELTKLNQEITALLNSEALDEKSFHALSVKRDLCIKDYLSTLDQAQKTQFCEAEIKVNEVLVDCAQRLFNQSLKELSGLIRGRKAVKKYY